MPFDGDFHKMMGLIAHPGEITSLSVSGDGNYLATAGGKDLTVNLWKINAQAMQVTHLEKRIIVVYLVLFPRADSSMTQGIQGVWNKVISMRAQQYNQSNTTLEYGDAH